MMIHDLSQREYALDPKLSFIVQAPAGSGKTELLVRRYLTLLANAQKYPEEILAITFTRKAASEMRQRVLKSLAFASQPEPQESHLQATWQLAKKIMLKDQSLAWNLLENPNRLRIQTIDSFCHYLVRQTPYNQDVLLHANLSENAWILYRQAARALLRSLEEENSWTEQLVELLLHLDNHHLNAEELFCEMLKKRDQWLPHIIPFRQNTSFSNHKVRNILETSLKNLCLDHLEQCFNLMPKEYSQDLIGLIRFAAAELVLLNKSAKKEEILACKNLETLPLPQLENFILWQGIAKFLLTQDKKWRKQVNVNDGFPSESDKKSQKKAMEHLLAALESHENFRHALENILLTPPPFYNEPQWKMIEILVDILPVLVAQLKTIFSQENVVDYTEISLNALHALGHHDEPSDLAMQLDQQIHHILVDEFQDTSISQFKLFEKLIAGWHPQENKTLFLVGDPMQSIYRFREAEVGLFLKAQQEGIGQLPLISLQLQCNFRSDSQLVDWMNTQFQTIFPLSSDITTGAIPFSASIAMNPVQEKNKIQFHAHLNIEKEADTIIDIIQKEKAEQPHQTICILVRAKSHLKEILPQLHAANLAFTAIEIESLANQAVVIDLLSLTKALLHLSDRIAWLAILRAPWLGLNLDDLLTLANWDSTKTICYSVLHHQQITSLSQHAQQNLPNFAATISQALSQRLRFNLSDWIQWTWLALGGEICLRDENELKHAHNYFELLKDFEKNSAYLDFNYFEEKLANRFTSTGNNQDQNLQIMTIHKAKGLEFDTVIIPSLERQSPHDKSQLLAWLDRPRAHGESNLILAPIKAKEIEKDPIYDYVRSIEKSKSDYEAQRLLYVALTRAKKNLHLLGSLNRNLKDLHLVDAPKTNSFLSLLWPYAESFFINKLEANSANLQSQDSAPPTQQKVSLKRLSSEWNNPFIFETLPCPQNTSNQTIQWIDFSAKQLGTLIHKILQQISIEGLEVWTDQKIMQSSSTWKKELQKYGLSNEELEIHLQTLGKAIENIINDPQGRWILHPHAQAKSEYPFVIQQDNKFKQYVIDRTFVDSKDNVRWIIDYKTSQAETSEIDSKTLTQYWEQLNQYAFAMSLHENLPIKLGLYFPLTQTWLEKNYEPLLNLKTNEIIFDGVSS